MLKKYDNFINESEKEETFEEFSLTRLKGATKIAETAQDKGGDSLLTYHHFKVKLPHYEKASDGKFDLPKAKAQYDTELKKLVKETMEENTMSQIEFQKLVGVIEVLGELIIRNKDK